jgi:hypothetical protein
VTPEDMPGPKVSVEALFPWLAAITPVSEPVRPKPQPAKPADTAQLRDAA